MKNPILTTLWGLLFFPMPLLAQEVPKTEVDQKIDVLAQEISKLKAGQELFPPIGEGKHGLAPAASKVYQVGKGVSLGGYGEMVYENFDRGSSDRIDFVRAILYTGYKFNDHFLFNSEVEFEHGSTERGGAVSVEFAYLDYLWKEALNFRAGMLLMPLGWVNELHEPPIYLGVFRPRTERFILPSTWSENGAGVFGNSNGFSYRAYFVNGLDGVGDPADPDSGFSAGGLRDGRQNGAEALASSWGFTGRVDYEGFPGVLFGFSGFLGNSGQGKRTPSGKRISALTGILDGHADVRFGGLEFRALMAYAAVDQADLINAARGLTDSDSVGSSMLGGYVQAGYDVLKFVETEQKLVPFFRWERLNTQRSVPSGFAKNPAFDRSFYTVGVSYRPIVNLVAKADYEFQRDGANTGVDQWNVGLGYLF